MKLKDTINFMLSKDYKKRFIAEYLQVKIRYEKLKEMLDNWDKLSFEPTCSKGLLDHQLHFMKCYIETLETRASIEGIDLRTELDKEIDYKEVVDKCLLEYKDKNLDWWTWEDFKSFLKRKIEDKYGKDVDLRSQVGREILHYARSEWENEEW